MDSCPRGAAASREGAHADGRRARAATARVAVGARREGVPIRDGRRHARAARALRRSLAAPRLPLHVRPQLRSRLSDLLVDGRHRRRRPPAPARARRDDALRLAGAAREAAGVQAPDGLEHAVGLVSGQRLQLRSRLLTHRGADARGDGAVYQSYATSARGLEFLMGYYGILDRAPKGRDEGDATQTWLRRHDEY